MIIPVVLGIVLLITGIGAYKQMEKKREGVTSVKLFQARLVSIPDSYKRMEWLAVPVDNPSDTILIDFDLGELPDLTSGDIVPVVGEQQSSGQWDYRYEPHWLDRRKFLLEVA